LLAPRGIAEKVQAADRSTQALVLNAAQTPSSRRWALAQRELVLGRERGRRLPVRGRSSGWVPAVLGLASATLELFADASGAGLAWSASTEWPAGTAWASAWVAFVAWVFGVSRASPYASPPASGPPKLPALSVGAPHPPESAAAPVEPTSSARPAVPKELSRRPRSATKLETTGPGHASRPKPRSLLCLP